MTAFLEECFARWVACGFTTHMEADLDRAAAGGAAWTGVREAFWGPFEAAVVAAWELRREDIRDALENAPERYLFAAAGEPVAIAPSRAPSFKSTKALRDAVNE